ncbi:MAG: hypothetical protein ACP5T9_03660 [Thermoplasmata archaeon]
MLRHSDRVEQIENRLSVLESQHKALLEKFDNILKEFDEIDKKMNFLNALSARLNNINYNIQYLLENEFSKGMGDLSTSIQDELSDYEMGFENIFTNIQKQVELFGRYMSEITAIFQSDPPHLPPDPSPRSLPYQTTSMANPVPGGGGDPPMHGIGPHALATGDRPSKDVESGAHRKKGKR